MLNYQDTKSMLKKYLELASASGLAHVSKE